VTVNRGEWVSDAGLVSEVDNLCRMAIDSYRANPNLITEHANHEESIRVGGYSNRTLLELVQNAADAMSGVAEHEEEAGRVEIVLDLDHQTLYCANAGRPFSQSGLTAIAHAHLSSKRGDEIGRFGLGFKSVLAVTDAPQVFSRSISFEFNSAEARASLATLGSTAKRLPVLRTITRIDAESEFDRDPILGELALWATTIVRLPHATKLESIKKEIKEFRSEFLLFVKAVREIRLRVIGADESFDTSHMSRRLGDGRFRIERPEGSHDDWYVEDRMHAPSPAARTEVGEAVSRGQVKVTVAMPARITQLRLGEFWSYFPLQDRTSASALFNAPWSVNDDRTTLLENDYNREILVTLSKMFVDILPKVSSADDPAAHLDYMPARGRETHSLGDDVLCAHVPHLGAKERLVPDAKGILCMALDLRPLDFGVAASEADHEKWIKAPNTRDDVPHWRCYTNNQRVTRLRQLYINSVDSDFTDRRPRDEMRALERIPRRGVLSWLHEWAGGNDARSAAQALEFVVQNPRVEGINAAKVIPTTAGMCSLKDRSHVFLRGLEDDDEGVSFVSSDFLMLPGVEKKLTDRGFRELDPMAILEARMAKLSPEPEEDELSQFWEAVKEVPVTQAQKVVGSKKVGGFRVPTCDGGWALPEQVLDIEGLGDSIPERTLDRSRCVVQLAHEAGVVHAPRKSYSVDDEIHFQEYGEYVLEELNRRLGPGERAIERVEFDKNDGPGPFSVLVMLEEAQASPSIRETWSVQLLGFEEDGYWTCEDSDTGNRYRVIAPVRWAVERAGLVNSTRGYKKPRDVVSASLVTHDALLPLFRGPRRVEELLELPKVLNDAPAEVLREALNAEFVNPAVKDPTLTAFVLTASEIGYPDAHPPQIPARVGRAVEAKRPDAVYLATTEEERELLRIKHKPFLWAAENEVELLVETVGCRRFEDSFSFSLLVDGRQDAERVIDVYTGLRSMFVDDKVMNASVAKAVHIVKRVTTEDGVEDKSLDWHLDGLTLVVRADLDERRVLEILNEAFGLQLTNAEMSNVLQEGVEQQLEEQRHSARAATSDAERLEILLGEDTLKDNLPKGLWQALEDQGLVDEETSVGELFRTVYGSDSVKHLAAEFRSEGYPDVPTAWAGGASTIAWLRKMGFDAKYAGRRTHRQDEEFVVPGAVKLNSLHGFQKSISRQLREVLTSRDAEGRHRKGMVELPTGAGKTRVATETVLRLFIEGEMQGTVLWIAQSEELCEQAVQTFSTVWRGLGDERPLTIGRLWHTNVVHEPDTEFCVVVATDAKLNVLVDSAEYEWLRQAAAIFVDEAHRAGGSTMYTKIFRWLGVDGRNWKRPLVGISATPFKGRPDVHSGQTDDLVARFGTHKIAAFDGNPYDELSKIGVLARVEHEVLTGVKVTLEPDERAQVESMRKLEPKVLDRIGRDQARMRILVDHILSRDPDWPVLVFTPNVLSAQVLAATLRYRGRAAEAVSGQTGRQERRDVIQRFKDGEIRVLANCDLLIQGFDAPGVRALYIARPTFSPNAYIQMAGRGLRGPANGGKPECLIVDVEDNFGAVSDFLGYKAYEDLWRKQGA
jgi:superfamily II DNA or RNA helicase